MTAPRRIGSDPAAAARAIADELGHLAVAAGRPELEARLRGELARWAGAGTTLVVAGETGRGKSSLINALLGQPQLLPVGDEGASTAVQVIVRHAPSVTVRVHPEGGGDPSDSSLDIAREWISQSGNPRNRRRIEAVEIGLPHPLLAHGLVIVDTPGIAGADAALVDATDAAIGWADALLFVTAASAPLSRQESDFLARASERVATVIVVLAKVDAYPGWRAVLEQDAAAVPATRAMAGGRILPVSSRLRDLGEQSHRDGDTDLARELLAESGLPALAAVIERRVLGRARELRLANLLRTAETVAAAIELPDRAVLAAADEDPDAVRQLEQANTRVSEASRATTAATTRVHDALELVRLDLNQRLTTALNDLARAFDARAAAVGSATDVETLAGDLERELVELARGIAAAFSDRIAGVLDEVAATYAAELARPDGLALDAPMVRADAQAPPPEGGLYGTIRTHYYPFLIGSGIVGTLGTAASAVIGTLGGAGAVAGVAAGAPIAILAAPIAIASLAAGALTALVGKRIAGRDQARQRARELARQAVIETRTELGGWLARAVLETRRALQDGLREELEEQTQSLRRAAESRQRTLRADRAARKRARDAATERLARIEAIRASIGDLRATGASAKP